MANLASIARPYALAAFQYAHEKQQLHAWKLFLDAAAEIASDKGLTHSSTKRKAKLMGNK